MNKKLYVLLMVISSGLAMNNVAQANSVTYLMDQSNVLPNGADYLRVTIDDTGAPGNINFTVTPLSPLTATAGSNFGIQKFGFNGLGLTAANITNLPSGWSVSIPGGHITSFGNFNNVISGTGGNRADPLKFSISGIDGNTIASYAVGNPFFVAHVAGFNIPGVNCNADEEDFTWYSSPILSRSISGDVSGVKVGGSGCVSGFFAGSTQTVSPSAAVPVPTSLWLLGSGLIGMVGVARRRSI